MVALVLYNQHHLDSPEDESNGGFERNTTITISVVTVAVKLSVKQSI